jgi:hypothetical protein
MKIKIYTVGTTTRAEVATSALHARVADCADTNNA